MKTRVVRWATAAAVAVPLVAAAPGSPARAATCGVEADVVTVFITGDVVHLTTTGGNVYMDDVLCGAGETISVFGSSEDESVSIDSGDPQSVQYDLYGFNGDDFVTMRLTDEADEVLICRDAANGGLWAGAVEGDSILTAIHVESGSTLVPHIALLRGHDTVSSAGCGQAPNAYRYTVSGGPGGDTITTGRGSQRVTGGSGIDEIRTGAGQDFIFSGQGADTVNGGQGTDYCDCGPNDTVRSIETLERPAP